MNLELSDKEAAASRNALVDSTGNDRYPSSARIVTLRAILVKIRPEPVHELASRPSGYEPPRAVTRQMRRCG